MTQPTPSGLFPQRKPESTVNIRRPGQPAQFSGFIIVRLASEAASPKGDTLQVLARERKLFGLLEVLDAYKLETTRRLILGMEPVKVLELEKRAQTTNFPPRHSLTAYWRIDARRAQDAREEIVKRLNALPEVDYAYEEYSVSEPLVNDANDTYAATQDYLDAAPTGIDARWAWTQPNGEGAGVAVVDMEQGWFPNHEDLIAKTPTIIYGDNMDGVGTYKGNHGTAVLGQIVGVDNTVGVVGAAPAVTSVRMSSHYDAGTGTNLNVAAAITNAIPAMQPGDVLLLEVQRNFLPTEVDDGDFEAIRLAVAWGIIVVEAAGNGDNDLDDYMSGAGDFILNRGHADYRESGAIMVGASESALPHDRWQWSNYGSRIDCYGWGENIVTCGYGDLDPGAGDNSTYTDTFGGTSGASPMIVGAALILQGMHEANTGTRLSPGQMQALLSNPATGTPQGAGRAGNISVMPNLRAIVEDTLGLVPDIYLRDNVGDTGSVPSTGSISASPDIIVRPDLSPDPDAEFGEGSGNENSNTLGYEAEAGQPNYVYVRMKNRGGADANGATATVYWSEVSTLVTPDMWNLIGTTAPVNAPMGDTLVVADPITWNGVPGTGHYCFVGLLGHAQDAAPPLPPATDWDGFRNFIRNHNNVTWRNFNVVDEVPDPNGVPAIFPFLIAGAPDKSREFHFEIIRRLPQAAEVWLEAPIALARRLQQERLLHVEYNPNDKMARIRLPATGRIPIKPMILPARARFRCRFVVKGMPEMKKGGHSIAIRQIFEEMEVGRVTWFFHPRKRNK